MFTDKSFIDKSKNNKQVILLKSSKYLIKIVIIHIMVCLIIVLTSGISNSEFDEQDIVEINNKYSQDNEFNKNIDFLKIINESSTLVKKEELKVENQDLDYKTYYRDNDTLLKGTSKIIQEGREGTKQTIIKITYEGNDVVSEDMVSENVIKKARNQIIEIGTKEKENEYTKVNSNIMYVNADTLNIRKEPKVSSEKLRTLNENDKVTVIDTQDLWTKIKVKNIEGWVLTEYLKENIVINNYSNTSEAKSKQQLLSKLNFNMNLYEPSGLTYEQFKKALSGNKQDVNKIIESNADYFYYAEQQYKINGIFLASVAIHESGWGTSKISLDKKNLFGYGAYDGSAYQSAWTFDTYAEGIDLLARVLTKYYLSPNGRYYNGSTLTGVNTRYATDKANPQAGKTKGWAEKVYSYMQILYNKI